jgi:hypothetical protein
MNSKSPHVALMKHLLGTRPLRSDALRSAPIEHGAYVLWLDRAQPLCLKVGIAQPGRRKGLQGRLRDHFSSHPRNTVLARHMAADRPPWATRFDFSARADRQGFLATRCYFQVLALPHYSKRQLREFEQYIEAALGPRYRGRVGMNGMGRPPARPAGVARSTSHAPHAGGLTLDEYDQQLVAHVHAVMRRAFDAAHVRVVVAKRIAALAIRERNRGRDAAIRNHPFRGICEASGLPLDRAHAHLDELDSELGYAGRLRWVCPRANNSGRYSCGGCK